MNGDPVAPLPEDERVRKNGNSPAGNGACGIKGDSTLIAPGLTKRELFAVMALQGWLSGRQSWMGIEDGPAKAVRVADALLKELAK